MINQIHFSSAHVYQFAIDIQLSVYLGKKELLRTVNHNNMFMAQWFNTKKLNMSLRYTLRQQDREKLCILQQNKIL